MLLGATIAEWGFLIDGPSFSFLGWKFVVFLLVWLLLFPFVLGPLVLRFKNLAAVDPDVKPVLPGQLPKTAGEQFAAAEPELTKLGFERVGILLFKNPTGDSLVYFDLWVHRVERLMAMPAVGVMRTDVQNKVTGKMVLFKSVFEDGTRLESGNSPVADVMKWPVYALNFPTPHLSDVGTLYQLHQQMVALHAPGKLRVIPAEGEGIDSVKKGLAEFFEHQTTVGLLEPDTTGRFYRATWKGALLFAWKTAWPVGRIRRALKKSRGRKIAAQFGIRG